MITPFVLSSEIHIISLRAKEYFRQLKLINLQLTEGELAAGSTASIEFTLLGDEVKFTCYSNGIPGSDRFNCFDLLEAAKQAMGAQNQLFERVEIRAVDEHYVGAYRIEGELEIDNDSDEK
ncbi:MAG: hypothetical protein ACKO6Q_04315 [Bacteroidota bacterium]